MRVLLTGAGGYVARGVAPYLERHHELRLLARRRLDDRRVVVADLERLEELLTAMDGTDAVVHLAVASAARYSSQDQLDQARFDINVKGTYNVLEAARRTGVKRVVYTSSLMVLAGHRGTDPLPADVEARPREVYGLTKYLGEEICRFLARQFDLSVIVLRIAAPIDPEEALRRGRIPPQLVAFPDLARAIHLAIVAEGIGFELLHIVGETSKRRWDLSRAWQVLGYRPEYNFQALGCEIGEWWEQPGPPRAGEGAP